MKNLAIVLFIYISLLRVSCLLNMEDNSLAKGFYTIITDDGIKDTIPQEHLNLSKVISDMLKDFPDNEIPIPLAINSDMLSILKSCLAYNFILHNTKQHNEIDKRNMAKNQLEEHLNTQQILHTILTFADKYNISSLLKYCMKLWAKKEYPQSTKFYLPFELENSIAQYMQDSKCLFGNIARWIADEPTRKQVQLLKKNLSTLSGLWSTAISNNGNLIAYGDYSGIIYIYNLKDNSFKSFVSGHPSCSSLQFDDKNNQIWSSGQNGKIKVWDLATLKNTHTFESSTCHGFTFRYIPDQLLVADGRKGSLCLWNLAGNNNLKIIKAHKNNVKALEATCDGSLFVSTAEDGFVHVRNTNSRKLLFSCDNQVGIMSTNFNYQKNRLACGLEDGYITIYDLTKAKKLYDQQIHTGGVWSVLFADPNDTLFCSGSEDSTIKLFDCRTYKCIKTLYGHTNDIQSMAINLQENRLVSASADKTVKIWDLRKLIDPIRNIQKEISQKCTIDLIFKCINHNTQTILNRNDPLLNNFSHDTKRFLSNSL